MYGREFLIDSDDKSLEFLFNKSNPSKAMSARIQRWSLRLMPYDLKIRHRPENANPAVYLSRQPVFPAESHKDNV